MSKGFGGDLTCIYYFFFFPLKENLFFATRGQNISCSPPSLIPITSWVGSLCRSWRRSFPWRRVCYRALLIRPWTRLPSWDDPFEWGGAPVWRSYMQALLSASLRTLLRWARRKMRMKKELPPRQTNFICSPKMTKTKNLRVRWSRPNRPMRNGELLLSFGRCDLSKKSCWTLLFNLGS